MAIPNSVIQQLITAHAPTLRNLSFIDCAIGTTDSLTALCRACTQLERLEVWIPVRDLVRSSFVSFCLADLYLIWFVS